jgi:hypothetical protein
MKSPDPGKFYQARFFPGSIYGVKPATGNALFQIGKLPPKVVLDI